MSKPEKVGGGESLRIACGHLMFTCNKKEGKVRLGKKAGRKNGCGLQE